jgi:hypothetical protein
MKIRKNYVVIIYPYKGVVELRKPSIFISKMSKTYMIIYDCSFNEAVHNIKLATKKGYYLIKK